MKSNAHPRQVAFGFVADIAISPPTESEWSRPQRAAPVMDHAFGEEVVLHDGYGDGHVCRIVARLRYARKVIFVRWPNSGGVLQFRERDGVAAKKRDARWRIAPADLAYLVEHPATFDDRGNADHRGMFDDHLDARHDVCGTRGP